MTFDVEIHFRVDRMFFQTLIRAHFPRPGPGNGKKGVWRGVSVEDGRMPPTLWMTIHEMAVRLL
jgi:hypothetical protein